MRLMTRTCLCTCILGAIAASAHGQLRAIILPDGADPTGTPAGSTSAVVSPGGGTITLAVWFQDAMGAVPAGNGLNGYQIIMPWFASGGNSGMIEYVDNNPGMGGGNSVLVDKANPDWVFANDAFAPALPVTYNETPTTIFGAIFNTLNGMFVTLGPGGNVPNPTGFNYIVQYTYNISPDACGTFTLDFNGADPGDSPPLTAFFTQTGAAYGGVGAVSLDGIEITVGGTNDDCANFIDLGMAQSVMQPYSTTCATADGDGAGCDGGANDIWFRYTAPLACQNQLAVTNTGGGTVTVYNAGVGCTPGAGDELSCGGGSMLDPGVGSGDTYLIRVSGMDVSGTLNVLCTGCTSNADCNDGNPCTTDTCNLATQVCSSTNNTLPCNDGNACTAGDICGGGTCNPGAPVNTSDFNPCTQDLCDPIGGITNPSIVGESCTIDDDCNINGVTGATCDGGSCACQASNNNLPNDTVAFEVQSCDNGGTAVFGACQSDSDCGPAPDGILQCSDDNDNPLDGGICVDQCCYEPGSNVTIDVELGPTAGGACGAQLFIEYDTDCLELKDKIIDPDGELGMTFVVSNLKGDGTIDLVVTLPPGIPCDPSTANFLGGTIARLAFTANGSCKCGGVGVRAHNPPNKITGPNGDLPVTFVGTDSIQIQGAPTITCPDDSSDHADCGSIFRTVTYGPVTVSDECEEVTADIGDLCEVEFRKACQGNLDCGRGDLCSANTDCGGGFCETDPLVDGAGFTCDGLPCTGYCTVDVCASGVCATPRIPQVDLNQFLDCSNGCQLPAGEVTIVCEYTNGCGRTATCESSHFNSGLNKLLVDVELSPSMLPGDPNNPITRCIDFSLSECDAAGFPVCHAPYGTGVEFCSPLDQNACGGHPEACFPSASGNTITISEDVVFGLPENLGGHGTACLKVPPGNWTCLTATDPNHSLTSTCTVACNENNELYAEFKGSKATNDSCHWLVQGNLDGNPNIDIADYTILAGEYLTNYGSNDTLCTSSGFNADFNGDGLVTLADWTQVVFNFFCASKDPCSVVCDADGAAAAALRKSKPRISMTRAELDAAGLGDYVDAADANNDGVVDLTDVTLFLDTVQDDGSSTATVEDLKAAVQKVERSHRSRELAPRSNRTR